MHTFTPPKSISDGPIINLLSILSILIEILSRHVPMRRGQKGFNGLVLKFGTFTGLFPSDGAASTAVNGLNTCITE